MIIRKKVSLYWDANWLDRQKDKVMRDKDEDGEGEGSKWNEARWGRRKKKKKELKQISSVHCDSLSDYNVNQLDERSKLYNYKILVGKPENRYW